MKSRHPILQRIKTYQTKAQRLLATLALLGTTLTASQSFAADDILFEPTGANTDLLTGNGHWQNAWGPAFTGGALVFEPTNPPPSGATGGSVYMQGNWTAENTAGWDCMNTVWRGGWYDAGADNFDGALYEYLVMDIKYDTNSTMVNPAWSIGLDQGWSHTELTNYTFATDGSWQHLVIPIAANTPNIGSSCGVSFYRWLPGGTVGTMGFWVANVKLIARIVPIAPPTVSTSKEVVPGLAMFADKLPSYLRGNVRTDTTGAAQVDWVGQASPANPVSYSWTISQFPGPGHADYRSDIVLTPDPVASLQSADPDWSATNALWISIQANANGTVAAGIAFKTNQVNGNSQMNPGGSGLLTGGHTLGAPTALGTWTLTFSNNTDMTLTAPNGASTNVSLPADVASTYTGVSFFLISAMGTDANVGQSVTYSALDITGVTTPVHEDFTDGVLNTSFLALMNQGYLFPWNLNPPSHRWVTSDARFWLKWSLPDSGFAPVSSPILPGSALDWQARDLTNSFLNGNQKWALVNSYSLPAAGQGFFALIKRVPTKLQVLIPSEVNAPGTVSGKTGTVDPVATGAFLSVTVNSTDAAWFAGGGVVGHTIHVAISPEDPLAITDVDGALANGTRTFLVQFGTPGTYTITATDVTDGSLTAGTSSNITVTAP